MKIYLLKKSKLVIENKIYCLYYEEDAIMLLLLL